jgi:hypothetical protein
MVDKTWRNEWLKLKSVEHKIKTLADAHFHLSAEQAQDVGRLAKRALFISVLNCYCTVPVTRSVASVPCQRNGRTFLDCNAGTRPEPCWFQVRKQSCTLVNFVVNLGNFLYLLSDQQSAPPSPMTHYPGLQDPLASFLSTVPVWSVLDKVALDNAIKGLPVLRCYPFNIDGHRFRDKNLQVLCI